MFYVIQTNTSLNDNNEPQDFQSMMYKINKQTWEEFKEYILSKDIFTEKIIHGTMLGTTKPNNCIIEKILINDDIHLEVILSYGKDNSLRANTKYYMITKEQFNNLQ